MVRNLESLTLKTFVRERAVQGATVFADAAGGYGFFRAMLKRGYVGTYHRMSREHLGRYVDEFADRHDLRIRP